MVRIKLILPFLLVVLIGAGCSKEVETVGASDSPRVDQTVISPATNTEPVVTDESCVDEGRVVFCVLAHELSQNDGIKIWQLDAEKKPVKKVNSWIWIVSSALDDPTTNKDWDGNWTFYMLNKYAGITRVQYDKLYLDKTLT